jgi:hypothetical protein
MWNVPKLRYTYGDSADFLNLRACLKNTRGSATGDFDCSRGTEGRASPKRAARPEPTKAPGKRRAAEPSVFFRHALRGSKPQLRYNETVVDGKLTQSDYLFTQICFS